MKIIICLNKKILFQKYLLRVINEKNEIFVNNDYFIYSNK